MMIKQQVTNLAGDNHAILKQQQLLITCVQTSQKVPQANRNYPAGQRTQHGNVIQNTPDNDQWRKPSKKYF